MPQQNPPDKVQREIEELLGKLDTFVPEERLAAKIRNRRKDVRREDSGPTFFERAKRRLSQISLGQLMLAGLALMLIGWLFDDALGAWSTWVTLGGLALTILAFVLSLMTGGARTTVGARHVQKSWRGQVIEYSEPSRMDRIKEWFRRRGRS
ncbi:MAG: hypothetical protein WEB52_02045 [Dehalococcoidia bacterium]